MAPLISQDIDSLIGGVSEQPDEIRKDSQVAKAENVVLDPSVGLSTRPSTTLVTDQSGGAFGVGLNNPDGAIQWHSFDGGPGHRYVLKFGIGEAFNAPEIKAINVETGLVTAVDIAPEHYDYLSKQDNVTPTFNFTTIGSSTFIANDRVKVELEPTDDGPQTLKHCIWMREPQLNLQGTGIRDFYFNCSDDEGRIVSQLRMFGIDIAAANSPSTGMTIQFINAANLEYWQAKDTNDNAYTLRWRSVGYGHSHPYDAADLDHQPTGAAGYGFLGAAGWNHVAASLPTTDPSYSPNALPLTDEGGEFNADAAGWMGGYEADGWTVSGNRFKVLGSDGIPINTAAGTGANSNVIIVEYNEDEDKLALWGAQNKHWTVSTGSSQNASAFSTERGPLLEDLPPICEDGFVTPITSDNEADGELYYLRFDEASGSWVEDRKTGEDYKLNALTMPLVIGYDPETLEFTVGPYEWTDRKAGDLEINKAPSFVGQTINDILLYRDRLAIASGTEVCFSEVKEPGNFFRTSVAALLDSDRIDLSVSGGADGSGTVTSLSDSPSGLLITTDRSQFLMSSGDAPFTGNNIKTSRLSNHPVHPRTSPLMVDSRFYWTTLSANNSNVWEYIIENEEGRAIDVTGHCPLFLSGGEIVSSASDALDNTIYFVNDKGAVFVYRHLIAQDRRIQAAWSRWTLGVESEENNVYKVQHVTILNGEVYFCTDTAVLRKLRVDEIDPCGWQVRVDARWETDSVSYDPVMDLTTFGTPFAIGSWANNVVDLNTGVEYENVGTYGAPRFKGDLTSIPDASFCFGQTIPVDVEFSRFILKQGQRRTTESIAPVLGGRTQVKTLTLFCQDSGPFTITTGIGGEQEASVHDNSNFELGLGLGLQPPVDTLEFMTDIGGRNTETTVSLTADSTQPVTVTSMRWEALFYRRGDSR